MRLQLVPPSERRRGVSGLLAAMRRSCRSHRAATSPFHPPADCAIAGESSRRLAREATKPEGLSPNTRMGVRFGFSYHMGSYSFEPPVAPRTGVLRGSENTARGRDNNHTFTYFHNSTFTKCYVNMFSTFQIQKRNCNLIIIHMLHRTHICMQVVYIL